jgi:hypothetical protein
MGNYKFFYRRGAEGRRGDARRVLRGINRDNRIDRDKKDIF